MCKQWLSNCSDGIHREADTYGVPVEGFLKAYLGPKLDREMPREFIREDVLERSIEGSRQGLDS